MDIIIIIIINWGIMGIIIMGTIVDAMASSSDGLGHVKLGPIGGAKARAETPRTPPPPATSARQCTPPHVDEDAHRSRGTDNGTNGSQFLSRIGGGGGGRGYSRPLRPLLRPTRQPGRQRCPEVDCVLEGAPAMGTTLLHQTRAPGGERRQIRERGQIRIGRDGVPLLGVPLLGPHELGIFWLCIEAVVGSHPTGRDGVVDV